MATTKLINDLLPLHPNRPTVSGRGGNAGRTGQDFRDMLDRPKEAAPRPQQSRPQPRTEEPARRAEPMRRDEPQRRDDTRQTDHEVDRQHGHHNEARKAEPPKEQAVAEHDQAQPEARQSSDKPSETETVDTQATGKSDEVGKSATEAAVLPTPVAVVVPLQAQIQSVTALLATGTASAPEESTSTSEALTLDGAKDAQTGGIVTAALAGAAQVAPAATQASAAAPTDGDTEMKAVASSAVAAAVAKPAVMALANEASTDKAEISEQVAPKSDGKGAVDLLKAALPEAAKTEHKTADASARADLAGADLAGTDLAAKAAAKGEVQHASSELVKKLAPTAETPKAQTGSSDGIAALQGPSQTTDASPTAAPKAQTPAQAMARADAPVPLQAVAVEIGMRAMRGAKEFAIRLDPEELGRVDIKLEISEKGEVQAKLVVERVETLQLLQRDARTLERAFDQAGLKTNPDGLQFTLRDPGQQGRGGEQDQPKNRDGRNGLDRETAMIDDIAVRPAIYRTAATSGLDIRI